MANIKSASELAQQGNQCILLMGPPKVGKTSFVCSGSDNAGLVVKATAPVDASDVLLLQVDPGGHIGGLDSGYNPQVWELSHHQGYATMSKELAQAIAEARALANAGKLKVVGLDLGALSYELVTWCIKAGVIPSKELGAEMSTAAADVDWNKVSAQGLSIFRAMRTIPCVVVAQTHVRVTQNNPLAASGNPKHADAIAQQVMAQDIASIGGEASKATADVVKGVIQPWIHASNMVLARDIDVVNGKRKHLTYTRGSMFQTGNRRQNTMPAATDASLKELLKIFHQYT